MPFISWKALPQQGRNIFKVLCVSEMLLPFSPHANIYQLELISSHAATSTSLSHIALRKIQDSLVRLNTAQGPVWIEYDCLISLHWTELISWKNALSVKSLTDTIENYAIGPKEIPIPLQKPRMSLEGSPDSYNTWQYQSPPRNQYVSLAVPALAKHRGLKRTRQNQHYGYDTWMTSESLTGTPVSSSTTWTSPTCPGHPKSTL